MKIWAYAICWNEEKILPYYLRHYEKFCDKIIIYDNESTDRSREIIKAHPKTELRTYITKGQIRDDVYLQLKEKSVYEAKDNVDYVIVGDIDEFLYHPDINLFLKQNTGFSFYRPTGFQMVSDSYPNTKNQIYSQCKIGVPTYNLCKPILFNPNKVDELKLSPGGHTVAYLKEGDKEYEFSYDNKAKWNPGWSPFKPRFKNFYDSPLKLLHYKYIGIDYVVNRQKVLANRLSEINRKMGWGKHYYNNTQKIFNELKSKAIKLNL